MTLGNRLSLARENKKISQARLSELLKIDVSKIKRIELDQTKRLDLELIQKISDILEVNFDWLLIGKGSEKKFDHTDVTICKIPVFGDLLSAGIGAVANNEGIEDYFLFSRKFIINEFNVDPDKLFAVKIVGDSMEPTLKSGNFVIVDRSTVLNLRHDMIYCFAIDTELYIKRIKTLDKNKYEIISDNKVLYESFLVDKHNINIIGKVISIISKFY